MSAHDTELLPHGHSYASAYKNVASHLVLDDVKY